MSRKVIKAIGSLEYVMPNDLRIYESPIAVGADSNYDDLVKSVCRHGVVEPVVAVTNSNEPGKFYVIDGIRRVRAARMCNQDRVPVYVLKLDLANPEHVPMINALSIVLRATGRLVTDDVLDMRIIGRLVQFIYYNLSDEALTQLKSGTIPSSAVNMLSDLVGVSTSTAYRWLQRVMSEHPELLISVLKARGLLKDVQESIPAVEHRVQEQTAAQTARVEHVEVQTQQQQAPPSPVVVKISQEPAKAEPEVRREPDVIICGGHSIPRSLYDTALNDSELGPFMMALCRKGLINSDVLQRLLNEPDGRKRQFIDENISVMSNRINIPMPATTIRRVQEMAVRYRTSQQDVLGKLGMFLYTVVRIIEEDGSDKPVFAKLDEVSRYAFADIETLKRVLREFILLLTD